MARVSLIMIQHNQQSHTTFNIWFQNHLNIFHMSWNISYYTRNMSENFSFFSSLYCDRRMSNCRCGMINDSPLFWHVVNISHSFALLSPSSLFGSVVKLTCRSFIFFARLLDVPLHRSCWSRFIHAHSSSHRRRHIGWWVMKISFFFLWVYASSWRMWNVRKSISLQISFWPESENLKITYLWMSSLTRERLMTEWKLSESLSWHLSEP